MVLTETKQFGGCVFMTLNDLKIGQSGIITAVGGEGALRLRLLDMGLIPKTRVRVQKVAPMPFLPAVRQATFSSAPEETATGRRHAP